MKYILNLPLALAALFQVWFAGLIFMSGGAHERSRGPMVALDMLAPAVLCWLLLSLAMIGAAFTDAFDWLPIGRRWLRRLLVLGAAPLIVALAAACFIVAIDGSAAVAGGGGEHLATLAQRGTPPVAVLLPFVLIGWLAWMIDLPPPRRDAALPRVIGLAALGVLLLVGGPIGTRMLVEEVRSELAQSAGYRQEEDKNEAENAAHFASLTDASPLSSWGGYATNTVYYAERFRRAEDAMRDTALRRLAARPTLEPDLAADLLSHNRYDALARDSDIAFLLVARVDFTPSAALEGPLRSAMSRIAAEMRKSSFGDRWTGDSDTLDSYIRSDYAERLAASLVIARRMADAGVDLRDALDDLQRTANEAYPKTKSAETYRRDVAVAGKDIDAALAKRK